MEVRRGKKVSHAKVTLALVLDDLTNPVELPLRKGAKDAAKKLGFDLKIVGPSPNTAQQQISLLQDLTAQKVNGIVILPVDSTALVPAINAAVDAGIPVATTELDAPTSKRSFFYFGGTPPLQQGQMQADKVAAYFKSKGATGTVNYVVTSCLPTVTGQQDRRKGFEQEAAKLNKTNMGFQHPVNKAISRVGIQQCVATKPALAEQIAVERHDNIGHRGTQVQHLDKIVDGHSMDFSQQDELPHRVLKRSSFCHTCSLSLFSVVVPGTSARDTRILVEARANHSERR